MKSTQVTFHRPDRKHRKFIKKKDQFPNIVCTSYGLTYVVYTATTSNAQTKTFPPQKEFSTQRNFFLYFPSKKEHFLNKDISAQKNFSVKEKLFILTREKTIFETKKQISYNYQKKQFFETKNFLYLCEKAKTLHFRCVLNMLMLFLIFENISQSLFVNYF